MQHSLVLAAYFLVSKADPLEDLRVPLAGTTFEAALRSLPFGTGLGSFVPVYGVVEKESDIFAGFANRAHNDLAEILLETGVFGLILLAGLPRVVFSQGI